MSVEIRRKAADSDSFRGNEHDAVFRPQWPRGHSGQEEKGLPQCYIMESVEQMHVGQYGNEDYSPRASQWCAGAPGWLAPD